MIHLLPEALLTTEFMLANNFLKNFFYLVVAFFTLCYLQSCKYDKIDTAQQVETAGYPQDVGNIFITRCSISGCHTTNDNQLAGGLDLSSWDALFHGARNGSPVVPFRSK